MRKGHLWWQQKGLLRVISLKTTLLSVNELVQSGTPKKKFCCSARKVQLGLGSRLGWLAVPGILWPLVAQLQTASYFSVPSVIEWWIFSALKDQRCPLFLWISVCSPCLTLPTQALLRLCDMSCPEYSILQEVLESSVHEQDSYRGMKDGQEIAEQCKVTLKDHSSHNPVANMAILCG